MNKRYQVFISSTYSDLQEERQRVITTVMKMDCIPAGMELFPASDDEQFEFIKRVIDDCDYYLLIIGGRYGSENFEGISYTEKEFDYAVANGIPVMSFVHGKPDDIPFGKSESDPQKRRKLEQFKNKVTAKKLVEFWIKPDELSGLVATSLASAFKLHPRPGWVRGSHFNNAELLEQINIVRIQNDKLQKENLQLIKDSEENKLNVDDLSFGDDVIELYGTWKNADSRKYNWKRQISWNQIFSLIGPFLIEPNNYKLAKGRLEKAIKSYIKQEGYSFELQNDLFQTIKIQLMALGLISVYSAGTAQGGIVEFIQITPKGTKYLMKIKTVKN